ncbi:uncharacterized protein LOC135144295 [Zophobas morio]|uniref:uncharacterized protein LOC135144295 n=1 Tax=Zophobas morio TaxID=2755281 RepID=UPI0030829B53
MDAILASDFSAVWCRGLNCKHPSWNSRADNSKDHILKVYTAHGLCKLGPQRLTHSATTGTMDVLNITLLEDVRLTMGIEVLHVLSSDHLPIILEMGDEKNTLKLISLPFTNWDGYTEILETAIPLCPSVPPTPALLDDAVALFESALAIARTTDTTTCEVTYRPNRLPDKIKSLICQRRRLI